MGRPSRIYRNVEPDMWLSADFRALSAPKPNARTLWEYLLTSPRSVAIPGVIVAHARVMASDLEWSDRAFAKCLDEIVAAGMAEVDPRAGMVVLTKALLVDGRPRETAQPTIKSVITWVRALARLPICALRDAVAGRMSMFFSQLGGQFPKAFADAMADSCTELIAFREPSQAPSVVHQGTGNREQGSISLGSRTGARDPGAQALAPESVPLAVGTAREAPAVDASSTAFDRELGELVDLAVATLDRARAELDPKARAIGLHGDQPGRLKLRDRLRAAGDARRADLEHCLAVLIAECRATGEVGNLRLGMLAGEASWERLRLATVASARGRDGPAARASPRADRGQAPVSKTAQRFDGDVPL